MNQETLHLINKYVRLAFEEDIRDGDHTSLSTIPADALGTSKLLVKEDGILAGIEIAEIIGEIIDPDLKFDIFLKDGEHVKVGDIAFEVSGRVQSILTAERLILNCMQRMSGIATDTAEYVQLLEGTNTKVLDTRKTTPNFRVFQKLAVEIGGGVNHRFGLFDMILIKDNHVDFAGGISNAINASKEYLKKHDLDLEIEIEVRTPEELNEVLATDGVDRIMLDNHTPEELKIALATIDGKYATEASGGITKETIRSYAETGVDYISVGALTHSARSLDLSLKAI